MKEARKILTYAVGGIVLATVSAYFAMPKEMRQKCKDGISNLISNKKCNCDCKETSK